MFYGIIGHGRLYTLSQLKTHAAGLAGAAFPRRSALDFRTGALVGAGGAARGTVRALGGAPGLAARAALAPSPQAAAALPPALAR